MNAAGRAWERGARISANAPPIATDHPIIRVAAACALSASPAPVEHPPDDHLARNRDGVKDEREEDEEFVRDLVRADLGIAHPREEGRGDEEARVERGGADEDLASDPDHRPHFAPARAPRGRVRTKQFDNERDAHPGLRDRGAGRRARDAPVEAVDEEQLEHDVHDVRDDDDLERPAQVGDAAEVALAGERDERRWQSERGDPEVRERVPAGLAVAAEPVQERRGDELAADEQREPDPERRPERLRRQPRSFILPTCAGRARDDRRPFHMSGS